MKAIKLLMLTATSFLGVGVLRTFLDRYKVGIYYIDKNEPEVEVQDYNNAVDLRGTPTHLCICGCDVWNIRAIFSDYEIASYFIDMECANCGSLATAPTPVDRQG